MTEPPDPAATPASEASASETAEQRRRRLAEVFGDVLPDTTSDERDPEAPSSGESATDTWLRAQVPPHHG